MIYDATDRFRDMARPGAEAWKSHTSSFDRVRAIVLAVSEPRSAEYIAEEAAVSVETTRDHLDSLVECSVVLEHDEGDQRVYSPDPLYTRFQTIRTLLDDHDRGELIEIRDELQAQIDAWGNEYGVDSLDELEESAMLLESPDSTRDIQRTISEWKLAEYRLNIIIDTIQSYDVEGIRK